VFIAHLDELGFDVVRIDHDGLVTLKPLGGFYNSLWEGQPALLHTGAGERIGVFVPRATATTKQPDTLTAWFGVDSAELARGGSAWVTGVKHSTRLGATRFSARSIDDRAGCTALLLALGEIDPAHLDHKLIFVFSVREETGLDGARAIAAELGPTVRRVHAVDTFVSSDSPLETGRFAMAPIGDGAVVRALDNSSATPAAEIDRVRRIAAAAAIPLQVGVTSGGNDGSELVRYGAVNVPLSWPLRYSHSPAEVIDLADEHALARLVAAMATAPTH
jgi:putative aminopeptidase FrvX